MFQIDALHIDAEYIGYQVLAAPPNDKHIVGAGRDDIHDPTEGRPIPRDRVEADEILPIMLPKRQYRKLAAANRDGDAHEPLPVFRGRMMRESRHQPLTLDGCAFRRYFAPFALKAPIPGRVPQDAFPRMRVR